MRLSKWARRGLIGLGIFAVAVPCMWIAIHEIPGFGPAMADGTRAVLGPRAVAWAEDVSYGIQDRINRWRYKDKKPTTFWGATPHAPNPLTPVAPPPPPVIYADGGSAPERPFPPAPFTAPYPAVAEEGDGTWIPVFDPAKPSDAPAMFKSIVHPDPKRGFAAVAVVAMDMDHVEPHLVAGSQEPQSDKVPSDRRPGVVPKEARGDLLAAFNGGFKAIHGHWGMMIGSDTFVAPRDIGCTVVFYTDGALAIRSWPAVKAQQATMRAFRQTPPCLVEEGKINTVLEGGEYSKGWGATVSGDTVIRRSAIGLDKTGHVLFYGLGEAVTAQSLSRAMRAVGAEYAAQLDVNYSYPRFLFYDRRPGSEDPYARESLIPDIKFQKNEYVGNAEPRDFFYVTRRSPTP